MNAEAERRRSQLGAELGDGSDDEAEDAGGARDGGDEEYYNLILNKTQKKKAQKEEARVTAANSRPNRIEEEMGGEGDKRAVSWQVMKNKGLTPRRKKEVRNPRVKKRMKFAEKTKKLASMKAVWKGGRRATRVPGRTVRHQNGSNQEHQAVVILPRTSLIRTTKS